jgi:DNA repair protein RAD16
MRLAANHPDLVVTKLKKLEKGTLVCGICQEEAEDAIQSKCKHVFCREDVKQYISSAPLRGEDSDEFGAAIFGMRTKGKGGKKTGPGLLCPVCFKELTIDLSQPSVNEEDVFGKNSSDVKKNSSIVNRIDLTTWRSSTKIEGSST